MRAVLAVSGANFTVVGRCPSKICQDSAWLIRIYTGFLQARSGGDSWSLPMAPEKVAQTAHCEKNEDKRWVSLGSVEVRDVGGSENRL